MKQSTWALTLAAALVSPLAHAQEAPSTATSDSPLLHRHRFSIAPTASFFLSSAPRESFYGAGASAAFFVSERWALTAEGDFLSMLGTPQTAPSDQARARAAVGAEFEILHATRSLAHGSGSPLDVFVAPRLGLLWTKPVSLVDPSTRDFSYSSNITFEVDAGARLFASPSVAVSLAAGVLTYNEHVENTVVATGADRSDVTTWYGNSRLRSGALLQLEVALLAPGR